MVRWHRLWPASTTGPLHWNRHRPLHTHKGFDSLSVIQQSLICIYCQSYMVQQQLTETNLRSATIVEISLFLPLHLSLLLVLYGKWSRPASKPGDQDDGVKEQRREGRQWVFNERVEFGRVGDSGVESGWQGTYRSVVGWQAEPDGRSAVQVSANKRCRWRRRQGKLDKTFPGTTHNSPIHSGQIYNTWDWSD